ncbi:hypothetical protein NDU88_000701 [Pleurodeles waltl]|uniref:Uncharacterized protein n=1 Tax=Pleurodeles waltl TaxID=8319 RepID=A0AAV7L9G7_PLEWA|nr:hypothetical protein NDU88_000701 [Pleurodeles waltl]
MLPCSCWLQLEMLRRGASVERMRAATGAATEAITLFTGSRNGLIPGKGRDHRPLWASCEPPVGIQSEKGTLTSPRVEPHGARRMAV